LEEQDRLKPMDVFKYFRSEIIKALDQLVSQGALPSDLDYSKVTCEPPREESHGDIATNAAMVLAKAAGKSPRDIAAELVKVLLKQVQDIQDCAVAGPGFVNLRIADTFWRKILSDILDQGIHYGDSQIGKGIKVNVEYASVNPTGPMHVGHCRVAVVADILAALLKKAGYDVTKEFYINDAGNQANELARSVYQRYCEALGKEVEPMGDYPGEYLIPVGKSLADKDGTKWINKPESVWLEPVRTYAIEEMMMLIRQDLDDIGIHHDVFTSERDIIERGEVAQAFSELDKKGLIYTGTLPKPKGKVLDDWEPRPLTLFKSSKFGDDSDRPLKKSDGTWAYIMGDIGYHYDKAKRGFKILINVWGVDHVGYVKRLTAATKALTDNKVDLIVKLYQLVRFFDHGQLIKMSKRTGKFISVRDVVERVGLDVVRFMMVTRKEDVVLDFDFAKVIEQSKDNPVFYVQYAHARAYSVMRHAKNTFTNLDLSATSLSKRDFSLLTFDEEIAMIRQLAQWPRQVEVAAQTREPHRLAFFLYDVAATFHSLWTKGKDKTELRFIVPDDPQKTVARLALVQAVANVIASGLHVIGVKPVEEMR